MRNPFRYGQIVGPEAFCNREQERADLTRAMENGERIFLFSERRMGKTSLALRALDGLSPERYLKIYVDLWPTDSAGSFTRRLAQAFAERLESAIEQRLQAFTRYISRLRPVLSVDDMGKPTLSLGLGDPRDRPVGFRHGGSSVDHHRRNPRPRDAHVTSSTSPDTR